MKTEDNIIKNLNSILSEQTMNSVFNDTDIINLVKNMKLEIEEKDINENRTIPNGKKKFSGSINVRFSVCIEGL